MKVWDYIFIYFVALCSIIGVIHEWHDPTQRAISSLTLIMCCGFATVYRKLDTFLDTMVEQIEEGMKEEAKNKSSEKQSL